MLFYIMAITTAALLLILIAPTLFQQHTAYKRYQNGLARFERLSTRVFPGNWNQEKLLDEKLISGQISKVAELNTELEMNNVIEPKRISSHAIEKVFQILLCDTDVTNAEKLNSLLHLKGQIKGEHLTHIRDLFIQGGQGDYLFDIELYRLAYSSADCPEKFDLLDFIASRITLTPDLISQQT